MSGIVGQNLGRGSGLVKTPSVAADSVTGSEIADDAIDSEHYTDGSIDNAHIADNAIDSEHYAAASIDNAHLADNAADTAEIADNAITLAKMAGGTDGNLISYDTSGNPVAVATGNDGQVLTSAGAGAVCLFEDAAGFDVTSITGATALAVPPDGDDEIAFSDGGTLKRLDLKLMQNRPIFFAYHSGDHAIPNGAATKLAFDTEVIDSDSCYDHDSTIGRATIPAGMGGVWVFGCKLYCPGIDSTEILRCELHINGNNATNYYGNMYHTSRSTNESLTIAANIVVEAAAADYFEWYCFQNSGDEQNLASKKGNNQIFGWRIAGGEL